jgi:hypothetical protein
MSNGGMHSMSYSGIHLMSYGGMHSMSYGSHLTLSLRVSFCQVVGCRDLKSSDGLPLLGPLVRFTCGGQPLVNLLDPATMRYIQKAAAAAASGPAASAGGGSEEPEETGHASDHGSVLYSGDYGRHGPKPKK